MDNRLLGLHLLTPAFGLLTALRGITALLGAHQHVVFENCRIHHPKCGANNTPMKLLIKMLPTAKICTHLFCSLLVNIHFRLVFLYNVHYAVLPLVFYLRLGPTLGPIYMNYAYITPCPVQIIQYSWLLCIRKVLL
jgi:hypothetical protein